jgi:hypothetical protein
LIGSSFTRKIPFPRNIQRDPSFFAFSTAGDYVLKYLGAVFKRVKPAEKDYTVLRLVNEVSCTIDL